MVHPDRLFPLRMAGQARNAPPAAGGEAAMTFLFLRDRAPSTRTSPRVVFAKPASRSTKTQPALQCRSFDIEHIDDLRHGRLPLRAN
jgi:hypothetical protein